MTGRASKGINPTKPELKLYLRFCGIAAEPLEILSVRFSVWDELVKKHLSNQYLASCRPRTKVSWMSKINQI